MPDMFRKFMKRMAPGAKTSADELLSEARTLTQQGSFAAAISMLKGLLETQPSHAEGWYRLGNAFKGLGSNEEALSCYQRANQENSRYPAALCNQGVVLLGMGKPGAALACFEGAIRIDPQDAIAHYNRALALLALSKRDDALAALGTALRLNPDYLEASWTRGHVHEDAQRWHEALVDFQHALALRSQHTETLVHIATCMARLMRWQEALQYYDLALAENPVHGRALLNRGNVLRAMHRWNEALASYDAAIAANPDQLDGHFNRGLVLGQTNRVPEALESFERAVALDPTNAPAQHSRSLALLQLGRLTDGFASYEWRWKNRLSIDPADYRGTIPLWNLRDPIADKRILVFSEQGLGDTLQFCRFVPLLADRGAQVILEVQPPLRQLLEGLKGATTVISSEDAVPAADLKLPLMSLPRALQTQLDSIPSGPPYLTADPRIVQRWRDKLGPRLRPRIGLAWSGNASQPEDRTRSIPLATLVQYLPREFDYYCLQREVRAEDQAVLDASPFISQPEADFVETAALCECLDLVISVCTSIAHLAGALGRPLWVLLSSHADWRWLLNRADSPWYPSARLYRQLSLDDWKGVALRVADDLRTKYSRQNVG